LTVFEFSNLQVVNVKITLK